jgi:drug/metabolite transporter (DMT)-like permease
VTALYWTSPMMTAVIAFFVLEESLHFVDWLATFVSFFGVLVITNPWAHSFEGMDPAKQFDDMIGSLAALPRPSILPGYLLSLHRSRSHDHLPEV